MAKKATTKKKTARKPAGTSKADQNRSLREAQRTVEANIKAIEASEQKAAKPASKPAPKPKTDKRPSGLDLAAQVLARAQKPLNAKEITERVLEAGWTTNGQTPEATLHAAIAREIKAKGSDARFAKVGRGLFESGKVA